MAVVLAQLGPNAIKDVTTGLLCALAFFASFKFKINPALLLMVGAIVGIAVHY